LRREKKKKSVEVYSEKKKGKGEEKKKEILPSWKGGRKIITRTKKGAGLTQKLGNQPGKTFM